MKKATADWRFSHDLNQDGVEQDWSESTRLHNEESGSDGEMCEDKSSEHFWVLMDIQEPIYVLR